MRCVLFAVVCVALSVSAPASVEEACDQCFVSFTKTQINPNCVCMAHSEGGAPSFFCAQNLGASQYIAKQAGGCRCKEHDMEAMGKTTCSPM